MSFLKAKKALEKASGLPTAHFRMIGSCTLDTLAFHTRAALVARSLDATIETLPFGTLPEHLDVEPSGIVEVCFILPWDICPAVDWRTGASRVELARADQVAAAGEEIARIAARCHGRILYLDAPLMPVWLNSDDNRLLASDLRRLAADAGGAVILLRRYLLAACTSTGRPRPWPNCWRRTCPMAIARFSLPTWTTVCGAALSAKTAHRTFPLSLMGHHSSISSIRRTWAS